MENKIYLVITGYYSDWNILGYFTDKELADKYCLMRGDDDGCNEYDHPYIIPVNQITSSERLLKIDTYYEQKIIFNWENNGLIMSKQHPDYEIYHGKLRKNSITEEKTESSDCIIATINQIKPKIELAERIAQDIVYQYVHEKRYKEGK